MQTIKIQNIGSLKKPIYKATFETKTNDTSWKVPKWLVGLGILGLVFAYLVFITALLVVYNAPRPGLFGEYCGNRSCLKELNLKCLNNTCLCANGYYYINKCVLKKSYNEKCHLTSYCKDNTNMVCRDGVCKCYDYQYWNNLKCINKSSYNQQCSNNDQCLSDSMLYCDTKKSKCNCDTSRYWSVNDCFLKRIINEKCYYDSECLNTKNLICLSKTCQCNSTQYWDYSYSLCVNKLKEFDSCSQSNQCLSPMTCQSRSCHCATNEYFETSIQNCTSQKSYGLSCDYTYQCRNDLNLYCKSSKCDCNATIQFWNGNRCTNYYTYNNQICTNSSQCKNNLVCRTSVTSCKCPSNVINKCDCPTPVNGSEYYWDGSDCVIASSYGDSCIADYACKSIQENTMCINNICTCNTTIGIWKNGICNYCNSGWTFINDRCFSVGINVSRIYYGEPRSSEVIEACQNESRAQLAILSSNEIITFFSSKMITNIDYFVNAYINGTTYKSEDGTWEVLTNLCITLPINYRCLRAVIRSGVFCFDRWGCINPGTILCEYSF